MSRRISKGKTGGFPGRPATPVRDLIAFLAFFQERPPRAPGYTALHFAVSGGHVAVVRALLDTGAAVDGEEPPGIHPVHLAVGPLVEDVDVLRLLLNAGAPPEPSPGREGMIPLMAAATWDRAEAARLLLDAGADVNARNRQGQTPLILAASSGSEPVTRLLLDAGADPEIRDGRQRWTALSWAESRGHVVVAELLRERGATEVTEANRRLADAVRRGDLEEVARALEDGAEANAPSLSRRSLLHEALTRRDPELVRLLLDGGAALRPDPLGRSPLEVALQAGNLVPAELLLERGSDPGAPRLLTAAAGSGSDEMVRRFLDLGADPNEGCGGPLRAAARAGSAEVVRLLLEAGANPNLVDEHGRSALGQAVVARSTASARLLREAETGEGGREA